MKIATFLCAALLVGGAFAQERNALVETFTSSTCPPCNGGNVHLEGLLADAANDGKTVSIKYQMNWPGTGDPYYTAEGGSRRNFYGVTGIPYSSIDAIFTGNTTGISQSDFNDAYAVPAKVDLRAWYQIDEATQTVDVQVDADVLEDFSTGYRIMAAIFEYQTTANVKSNGETQFEHVVKKMLPSATGTVISPQTAGNSLHWDLSHTFQGSYFLPANGTDPIDHATEHSVEEFSDLGVAVWIQSLNNKEVLQAVYAFQGEYSASLEEQTSIAGMTVFPNPSMEETNIAFNSDFAQTIKLDIVDATGKVVFNESVEATGSGHQIHTVNTSYFSEGLYTVRLTTATSSITKKLSIR